MFCVNIFLPSSIALSFLSFSMTSFHSSFDSHNQLLSLHNLSFLNKFPWLVHSIWYLHTNALYYQCIWVGSVSHPTTFWNFLRLPCKKLFQYRRTYLYALQNPSSKVIKDIFCSLPAKLLGFSTDSSLRYS